METKRDKVGRLIGEAGAAILRSAMAGFCCAAGQPLCPACALVVSELKRNLARTVDKFSDLAVEKLAAAPPGVIESVAREMVEPQFRRMIAADLPN
jgi:hypothetical protein